MSTGGSPAHGPVDLRKERPDEVRQGPAWIVVPARVIALSVAWLARILLVLPAKAVWRYVLAPVIAGIVAVWRLAGRLLRWLWRTFVVGPVRILVVGPARWAWRSVLRPVGRGVREAWRVSVRDPLRTARQTVRETSRDVRRQLRRTFRGN